MAPPLEGSGADSDPCRISRLPQSVSPEAQLALKAAAARVRTPYPESNDRGAWEEIVARGEAEWLNLISVLADLPGVTDRKEFIEGVPVFLCTPDGAPADRVFMDIHGGGFVMLGGEGCRLMARMTALRLGITVLSVDYRMPPSHPYPDALDDCLSVYKWMVQNFGSDHLVVGGTSAGGNLAAATVLRARDEGVALPSCLVLLSPALDLTESGDTFITHQNIDVVLRAPAPSLMRLYAGGADLTHPYLSPLFGDFAKGFPPTLVQSGTRDIFLSNVVRMHRALRMANVSCELHVFEAMPHGGFGGAPEDMQLAMEVRRFIHAHLPASR